MEHEPRAGRLLTSKKEDNVERVRSLGRFRSSIDVQNEQS